MKKQMQLTLTRETMEALQAAAAKKGITANILARMILHERFVQPDTDTKSYTFTAKNWKEIEAYVETKRLNSVEVFAGFAIAQYISRNALTAAQKHRIEEKSKD